MDVLTILAVALLLSWLVGLQLIFIGYKYDIRRHLYPEQVAGRKRSRIIPPFLVGWDFFISHAWADAKPYAKVLAGRLRTHHPSYKCFLDVDDLGPGGSLGEGIEQGLRDSTVLILVGSPNAPLRSQVISEVKFFDGLRRPIVAIDIGETIKSDPTSALAQLIGDRLRVDESREALISALPSAPIFEGIVKAFHNTRRRTRLIQSLVGTVVAFALIATVAVGYYFRAEYQRRQAVYQQDQAEQAKRKETAERMRADDEARKERAARETAQRTASTLAFERGGALGLQWKTGEAAAWISRAMDLAPTGFELLNPIRYNIAYYLDRTPSLQAAIPISYTPYALVFHPDGKRLFSAGNKGKLETWDVVTGQQIGAEVLLDANIERMAISPDGATLYCAGTKGLLYRRKSSGANLDDLPAWPGHTGNILAVAVSPNGQHVATGGEDGLLIVREAATEKVVLRIRPHGRANGGKSSASIRSLAFSPNGRDIASAGWDGTVRVTDWQTQKELAVFRLKDSSHPVYWSVCYVTIGGIPFIFSGDFDGNVRAWKNNGDSELIVKRSGVINALTPQPDRTHGELLIASLDQTGMIWLGPQNGATYEIRQPRVLESATWNPTGELLATGSSDAIRIWHHSSKNPVVELPPEGLKDEEKFAIGGTDISSDGTKAVMTEMGHQGRVWIWEFSHNEAKSESGPVPFEVGVTAAKFSPDGNHLLIGRIDGGVHLWNLQRRQEEWRLPPAKKGDANTRVRCCQFSPDGNLWSTSDLAGKIKWGKSYGGGAVDHELRLPRGFVYALAFNQDGSQLVVAAHINKNDGSRENGELTWWKTSSGIRIGPDRELNFLPFDLKLTADEKSVLVGGLDRRVTFWDMETHAQVGEVSLGAGARKLVLGYGGDVLLALREDDSAELWHLSTRRPIGNPFYIGDTIAAAAFTTDHRMVFRGLGRDAVPTIYQVKAPPIPEDSKAAELSTRLKLGLTIDADDRLKVLTVDEWLAEAAKSRSSRFSVGRSK